MRRSCCPGCTRGGVVIEALAARDASRSGHPRASRLLSRRIHLALQLPQVKESWQALLPPSSAGRRRGTKALQIDGRRRPEKPEGQPQHVVAISSNPSTRGRRSLNEECRSFRCNQYSFQGLILDINPSLEGVQEFRVVENNYKATFRTHTPFCRWTWALENVSAFPLRARRVQRQRATPRCAQQAPRPHSRPGSNSPTEFRPRCPVGSLSIAHPDPRTPFHPPLWLKAMSHSR